MKLEADWKRWMVDSIKAAGGYARRVEDQFAVGTLDLILIHGGYTVLAEAKRYKGNHFEPTARQHVEMMRIDAAGGKAILIGVEPGLVSFSPTTERAYRTDRMVRHYTMDYGPFHKMFLNYMEQHYQCPTIAK